MSLSYKFFKRKEPEIMKHVGEGILGVEISKLDDNFIKEMDYFLSTFEKYHQTTIHLLIRMVSWPLTAFLVTFRLKSIKKMTPEQKTSYLKKWKTSPLGNLRTGYTVLASLVGYAYYVLEETKDEIGYLGSTIGREHELPTLLKGKEPWRRPV